MRVLRLCSVFESFAGVLEGPGVRFDPIGGLQNHAAELTRSLDRLGVVQTVLTTRPPGSPAESYLATGARVLRVGAPYRYLRQGYGAYAARRVPSLAAGVDVIHAHQGEDLAVLPVAVAVARAYDVPLVITVHASMRHTLRPSGPRSLVLKALGTVAERWGERRADAVITLTSRTADLLRLDGLPPHRLHVVPSGVDPALFAAAEPDAFVAGLRRRRVLYVGRLHAAKGVMTLIEAIRLTRAAGAAPHLVMVGDGPARPRVMRALRGYGIDDTVELVGAVPHERVPGILAAGDVLVLPSHYEELGSILLEAMQVGLPIVATRVGGVPTIVEDEVTGLLVPPNDPASLAAAIGRLLSDPGLSARLGNAGRERAARYAWPRLALRVLDVYRNVTRAGPARPAGRGSRVST